MCVQRSLRKRVCILGAGAAGLCAARHSVDAGHDVTIFEQQHDLGGTWLYSPEINAFSSLYEKMYTNIPKEVMSFMHLPLETSEPRSFVRHQEILAYLQRYGHPVRHLIKFNTAVTGIRREGEEWKVTVRPAKSTALSNGNANGAAANGNITRAETFSFDVVFICHGHFSQPRIPAFAEKLAIPWIHCHNYRRPHAYTGKEVVVVGAGPSGVDVAIQVAKYARKVHMLHNRKFRFGMPSNVDDNARLADVASDGRTLLLENGETLASVDAVILCTGYHYEVPFCERELLETKFNGQFVSPLYLHCVHTRYPTSLFVIGLNANLIPFVCCDHQVRYALALVDGSAQVPAQEELDRFEEERLRELKENGNPVSFFHQMGKDQWPYFERLAKLSGHSCLPPVIQKLYDFVHERRTENLATFKSFRYRILDTEHFDYESCVDLDCN